MNTDENDRIIEFEEKPKKPKSNKASMGVYIFTWEKLYKYLTDDEADKGSSNDFGKNIIPNMLNDNQVMMAYNFTGYWKDVGTIESLWEANMDLLENPMPMDMHDKKWRIYAKNPGMPPHYIAKGATVTDTLITEGGEIYGNVHHSILFAGVVVEEGAYVESSVIMPGSVIKRGAVIRRTIVAENAVIGAGAIVGEEEGNIAVVGQEKHIPLNSYVSLNKPLYDEESDRTLLDVIMEGRISDPEELIINRENLGNIHNKISEVLSGLEQEVLQAYLDGKSYQEIADALGRHVKSIDNALQRVKRKLEKYLEEKWV